MRPGLFDWNERGQYGIDSKLSANQPAKRPKVDGPGYGQCRGLFCRADGAPARDDRRGGLFRSCAHAPDDRLAVPDQQADTGGYSYVARPLCFGLCVQNSTFERPLRSLMNYKGIEYQIVQTSNPTGWKWTFQPDENRTRTSTAPNRAMAVKLAEYAIDKFLKANGEQA